MIRVKVLKHLLGTREGKRGGIKGDVRRGAIEKGWHVRVIERKEVKEITQLNTSSPRQSEVPLSPRGMMAVEVPQNKEISREGKNKEKMSWFCYLLKKSK